MTGLGKSILVVGASGRSGGLVAQELAKRDFTVKALVRDHAGEHRARANGATEVAIGDLRNSATLDKALDGVYGVYHVGPPFVADEAELGVAMVEAARRAKVGKFVFSSVIHPANGLANHTSKLPVEAAILKSGLDFTILYPATLFQNFAAGWKTIAQTGVFAEPYGKEVRLARVDYRDVAEVVAIAFLDRRLSHGSFELAADGMPDRGEIARLMSEVLGKLISVAVPSFQSWAAQAQLPFDERQLRELERVYESYSLYGSPGNSLTLRAILGREPRALKEYFQQLAVANA
ncbi:NmrA family NAD(P)-binding protein [Bradyrhizobium sp. STM 3562]|uniref:NmrA family NAD(P)-binding protein n=1 Tax=Bradyrhizobium sp. STM 3562 TaxID=578924 RepID=UPI00388E0387